MSDTKNRFTDKFVKSKKPKEKQKKFYDVREKSGQGFGLTVFPSGKKSFIYMFHFGGRKRRMTLGAYPQCTLDNARVLHREALKVLASGKDPALEKRKASASVRDSASVDDLIREYIEKWAKPRKRSWKADERLLRKDVKPAWGNVKASDITRRDIILLLDKIKDRGASIGSNRTLACVRRMFNFAVERDLIKASPCVAVKAVAKENHRDRVLSVDEIKSFWCALDDKDLENNESVVRMSEKTTLALKFQLVTGQRKGEVIAAEWSELDLISGWWTIPAEKTKNNNIHRVPLSKLALDLLQHIKKISNSSRFLFPAELKDTHITGASIDHALRRSKFANIKQFTPHDLRRTGASHMTAMGISRLVVSKILNHISADNSITAVYDRHSYDDEKKSALDAWSRKLNEIINDNQVGANVIQLKNAI